MVELPRQPRESCSVFHCVQRPSGT